MELWIKDLKYLRGDRMSRNRFQENQFRILLHASAYVLIHRIKQPIFRDKDVKHFTIDSFIKRIMLRAVQITEKKTFVRISFVVNHRHREELQKALMLIQLKQSFFPFFTLDSTRLHKTCEMSYPDIPQKIIDMSFEYLF